MRAVAVGGLDDQHVAADGGRRVGRQGRVVAAHVAAEQDREIAGVQQAARPGRLRRRGRDRIRAAPARTRAGREEPGAAAPAGPERDADLRHRRPEQVPDVDEAEREARRELLPALVGDRLEVLHDLADVPLLVEGKRRAVLGRPLLVQERRVFLLQPRRVQQHHAGELGRRRGGVHRAPEAGLVEAREPAAVVDVRVGQDDVAQRPGVELRALPVQLAQRLQPLEQAAIHERALAPRFDHGLGAGDGAGRAVKSQCRHRASAAEVSA